MLVAVLIVADANDRAMRSVDRRKQCRGFVALVVLGQGGTEYTGMLRRG